MGTHSPAHKRRSLKKVIEKIVLAMEQTTDPDQWQAQKVRLAESQEKLRDVEVEAAWRGIKAAEEQNAQRNAGTKHQEIRSWRAT
jgi:hypothetical protein